MPSSSRPSQETLGSLSTCATSCLRNPKQQHPEGEPNQESGDRTQPRSAGSAAHSPALFLLPNSWHLSSRKGQQVPVCPDRQQELG